jgi:GntR family transcriptional regulator, transcriptional repressor for pyruvate dehydrogenase complex
MPTLAVVGQPISGRRLHEAVVEHLARQIVGRSLPPGTLLPPEPRLAIQFGVSRTVVREAVRLLAAKGLVSVKHGSGVRVQPPDAWARLDPLILYEQVQVSRDARVLGAVLEVRRLLEGQLARLAAARRSAADVERLEEAIDGLRDELREHGAFGRWDLEFHDRIFVAAGNPLLREMIRPVTAALFDVRRLLTDRPPAGLTRSQQGHEAIFAAVQAGDPDAAGAAMLHHVAQFESELRASWLFQPAPPPETVIVGSIDRRVER